MLEVSSVYVSGPTWTYVVEGERCDIVGLRWLISWHPLPARRLPRRECRQIARCA